jgi:hypothetical protein
MLGCGSVAAAVLFDRSVHAMAPALATFIFPLLPIISHFAFDFYPKREDLPLDTATCHVPALSAPFGALPCTLWFRAVTRADVKS